MGKERETQRASSALFTSSLGSKTDHDHHLLVVNEAMHQHGDLGSVQKTLTVAIEQVLDRVEQLMPCHLADGASIRLDAFRSERNLRALWVITADRGGMVVAPGTAIHSSHPHRCRHQQQQEGGHQAPTNP